jgi:ligand-binding sensor domain-containing protein
MKRFLILFILSIFYQNYSYSQVDFKEYLEGATVNDIVSDGASLWFSTYSHGIFQYLPGEDKWKNYSTKAGNLDNDLFYCIAASKDFVWAGTSDGLFIFDRKRNQWRKRKFAVGGEFGNWIRSLKYDPAQNILWIGRFRNITRLDVARQRFDDFDLTLNNDPKTNTFKVIKLEGSKYVWFGTEAGAYRYEKSKSLNDKSSLQFFSNKSAGFKGAGEFVSITDMLFDANSIWFGTDEFVSKENPDFNLGGVYKFNRRATWEKIDQMNGLAGNGIYALEKSGNYIWAGIYTFNKKEKKEYGRGLALIERNNNKVIKINPDDIRLASNSILALYFDGNSIWIGTDNGLWRVEIMNPMAKWAGKKSSVKK